MRAVRRRLDNELVRRCLVSSRAAAQALIRDGRVLVSGSVAIKPSRLVSASEAVHLSGEPARFVSRGGEKLDAALSQFNVKPAGLRIVDFGASTGGFVDCLLQRGASAVVAIDVGWGQLDARLRADPRVSVRERCNVRHVGPADIGGEADIITADLSFISLRTVMANLAACTRAGGEAVMLTKPQFEAGRIEVSRGKGVVRDSRVWRQVLSEVASSAARHGLEPVGVAASKLRGAAGNVEFFLHCRRMPRSENQQSEGGRLRDLTDTGLADTALTNAIERAVGDGVDLCAGLGTVSTSEA